MARRCGNEAEQVDYFRLCPATGYTDTGEREPKWPYNQIG